VSGTPEKKVKKRSPAVAGQTRGRRGSLRARAAERELLDFIALVMLAIKEEIEDLRQSQTRTAQAFSTELMDIGRQLPETSAMASIVGLMQSDDLRNQRQQHVVNALRYVEDLIREHFGRDWAPKLTDRATGWGEGLLASQNLEQVRAHFHHYLLERPQAPSAQGNRSQAGTASDVELF